MDRRQATLGCRGWAIPQEEELQSKPKTPSIANSATGRISVRQPRQTVDHFREPSDCWPLKEAAKGEVDAERIADPRHRPDRHQRLRAELKEIVIDTDMLHVEQLFPYRRECFLRIGARLHNDVRGLNRIVRHGRKFLAINLAV